MLACFPQRSRAPVRSSCCKHLLSRAAIWPPRAVWAGRATACTAVAARTSSPQVLCKRPSLYNNQVTVVEVGPDAANDEFAAWAGARVLLLDDTGNLHSVYRPHTELTGGLWDVMAGLPSLVPPGPIAMLGLGAGSVPRIIAAHYPTRAAGAGAWSAAGGGYVVHGWELDPEVVAAARRHLGMSQLEAAGQLVVHVGDALSPAAAVPGGFSGIVVDLFGGGRLLPQLTKRETWESIRSRLAPTAPGQPPARVIANLGQSPPTTPGQAGRWQPEAYTTLRAYEALEAAFEGEVSLMTLQSNTLALTGPLPSPEEWPGRLPAALREQLLVLNGGGSSSGSSSSSSNSGNNGGGGGGWRESLEQQELRPGAGGLQAGAGGSSSRSGCWARDLYPLQKTEVNLSLF